MVISITVTVRIQTTSQMNPSHTDSALDSRQNKGPIIKTRTRNTNVRIQAATGDRASRHGQAGLSLPPSVYTTSPRFVPSSITASHLSTCRHTHLSSPCYFVSVAQCLSTCCAIQLQPTMTQQINTQTNMLRVTLPDLVRALWERTYGFQPTRYTSYT